jgi:hypothetical protein
LFFFCFFLLFFLLFCCCDSSRVECLLKCCTCVAGGTFGCRWKRRLHLL